MEKIFYTIIDEQSVTPCNYMKGRQKYVGSLACIGCKHYKGEGKEKRGEFIKCDFNKNVF